MMRQLKGKRQKRGEERRERDKGEIKQREGKKERK